MKVNSQNLRLKFLSQLRKHLRSPQLNKILRKRRRKKKTEVKYAESNIHPKRSPRNSFRVKLIKKAGEKLKEGFKRHWESNYVAKRREELIELALKKHKIITASSVVTSKDTKLLSQHSDGSSHANSSPNRAGDTSVQNSSAVIPSSPAQRNDDKAHYLHCSSEESSPCVLKGYVQSGIHQKSPSVSTKPFQRTGASLYESTSMDESSVESESECPEEISKQLTKENKSVEKRVQFESSTEIACEKAEDNYFHRGFNQLLAPKSKANTQELPAVYEEERADHNASGSGLFQMLLSSSVEREANTLLEKMAKYLQGEQNTTQSASTDPPPAVLSTSQEISTPHHSYDLLQLSCSANWTDAPSLFHKQPVNHSKERSSVSENISKCRPRLLKRRHDDITRLRPTTPFDHPDNLYYFSSDSDSSEDEILKKMKRKVEAEEKTIDEFFASGADRPSTSRPSSRLFVSHRLLESDSSPELPFSKPFFRH